MKFTFPLSTFLFFSGVLFAQTPQHRALFTENKGQVSDQFYHPRPDVLFSGETGNMIYHLRRSGISYQLYRIDRRKEEKKFNGELQSVPDLVTIYRTDICFKGTNENMTIVKGNSHAGIKNYYLSVCPEGVTHVNSYESITYRNIYPGIDLRWYDRQGQLEYDFIIDPGTDHKKIRWEIKGAKQIFINQSGELVMQTPLGEIREASPVALQGEQVVNIKWALNGNMVGFEIEAYDPTLPLIIDPVIRGWGTYYGGSIDDFEGKGTVDNASNVYMSGRTTSLSSIATTGSHQNSYAAASDAFLVKFNSSGVRQWATYYGGTNAEDGLSCITDASQNVYMTGLTYSSPTAIATAGSHQSSPGGINDVYLVKFNSNGVRQWGTYFGGAYDEVAYSCAIDASSSTIYITGFTSSNTAIATSGSHQDKRGGKNDAFLAAFSSSGALQWATYYGGIDSDLGTSCATDAASNIYITGYTSSNTVIATAGSHQSNYKGSVDAFLVKFNSSGVRQWGTYYGGSDTDEGYDCVTDDENNVYLSGLTNSNDSIATPSSHQSTPGGGTDAFLVKFNDNGTREWATYYGGPGVDKAYSCSTDPQLNVYLTGNSSSSVNIATMGSFQDTPGGSSDAFLAKFDGDGIRKSATYYGGLANDGGFSCMVDAALNVFVTGESSSASGIATTGSHQDTYGGGMQDRFLVKFLPCVLNGDTTTVDACESYTSPSGKHTWTASGTYLDTLTSIQGCDSITTIQLSVNQPNTTVTIDGTTLISAATPAAYQWVDCNNNYAFINGANLQSFTAIQNGSYAVILAKSGCVDTSDCYAINWVGMETTGSISPIHVYPNPNQGELTIDLGTHSDVVKITLYNLTGQKVDSWQFLNSNKEVIEIDRPAGIYLLKISTEETTVLKQVIKN